MSVDPSDALALRIVNGGVVSEVEVPGSGSKMVGAVTPFTGDDVVVPPAETVAFGGTVTILDVPTSGMGSGSSRLLQLVKIDMAAASVKTTKAF